jgi:predicted phosphodiesterase
MKFSHIRLMSDIHLEFKTLAIPALPNDKTTLLILAGDIAVYPFNTWWFANLTERFAKVIYVCGNHEHYHGNISKTKCLIEDVFEEEFFSSGKIHVVDEAQKFEFDGLRILAGTLWTDVNNGNSTDINNIKYGMNDYRYIGKTDTTVIHPKDTIEIFDRTVFEFREWLNEPFDGKTIIVTHHLPTYQAIHPRFRTDRDGLNAGYASNLESFIEEYQPDYWFFGHSHSSNDFFIGNTHLISNPRGYANREGIPENKEFNEVFLIELDTAAVDG